ncbi:AAC(3) family N-acetyltransferase [Anaerolineales bacterium HSG6]|nr:AAC(3) family N-acetyltransferase [Anaerolineales bacterium HSG6]MDM8531272.1 AAC(3) family N-acetyltransferase [Anaerolineales bacterium HSG25]
MISGGVLVVHSAFSKVKLVEGGPVGLIQALQTVLGSNGTLIMPSMTEDDDHVFDPQSTPCHWLGERFFSC